MHLLALEKPKKTGGPITPSKPLGHSLAILLQPQASPRRGDKAESPGHYTKASLSAAVAACGQARSRKRFKVQGGGVMDTF